MKLEHPAFSDSEAAWAILCGLVIVVLPDGPTWAAACKGLYVALMVTAASIRIRRHARIVDYFEYHHEDYV